MEICMTSSSAKPNSVAIREAFSSALSTVSSVESRVYETRCSVMDIVEGRVFFREIPATAMRPEALRRLPEAFSARCGSLPVGRGKCQRETTFCSRFHRDQAMLDARHRYH